MSEPEQFPSVWMDPIRIAVLEAKLAESLDQLRQTRAEVLAALDGLGGAEGIVAELAEAEAWCAAQQADLAWRRGLLSLAQAIGGWAPLLAVTMAAAAVGEAGQPTESSQRANGTAPSPVHACRRVPLSLWFSPRCEAPSPFTAS